MAMGGRLRNHEQFHKSIKGFSETGCNINYLAKDFNIRLRIVPKVEKPERSKIEVIASHNQLPNTFHLVTSCTSEGKE